MMDWVYLATGFTGALTLTFLGRLLFGSRAGAGSQVLFAPSENGLAVIRAAIQTARKEILVQATTFAVPELAQALVDAKLRGVAVEVLLDLSQERDPGSVLPFLLDQGLAPLIDHENRGPTTQLILIDQVTVFAGGWPLAAAQEGDNSEWLMVMPRQPELAARFRQQYFLFREQARPPQLRRTATTTPAATPTPTPAATPTPTPSMPPLSDTLAQLLPGRKGVNRPSQQELDEEEKAA